MRVMKLPYQKFVFFFFFFAQKISRIKYQGQNEVYIHFENHFLPLSLQNYHKREVMALALPVAVKFLHKGNRELSRNMSSYLSLAAIEAADLLAMHIQPIIDSVISGKERSLCFYFLSF